MKFYTSIFRNKNSLFLRGYDFDGKRKNKVIGYKPHLYVPSHKAETHKNLKGQNVARVDFESMSAAREFIQKYEDVGNFSVYGYTRFEYTFLADEFKTLNYDVSRISIGFLDIEVHSTEGFPHAEKAEHPVTVISLMKGKKIVVLATKDYEVKDPNVTFYKCKDEHALLHVFLKVWEHMDLDVVSGWNINGFDIPYLINRITKLYSSDEAAKLSPWRRLVRKERKAKSGRVYVDYIIQGIACLDYLEVYKKFVTAQRDSYRLDNIAWYELKQRKLDYSQYQSLGEMWELNPQMYIDYNIHDTRLVKMLEDKLKFLELVITVAYDARVSYEDAMTSVLLWEVIIMNYLNNKKIVMPSAKENSVYRRIVGGHVKEPIIGLHDWVVSFDLTSLYPHIIMGWNISPETAFGKSAFPKSVEEYFSGEVETDYYKKLDVACAGNNCLYKRDEIGFLPALMFSQFQQRDEYKQQMKTYKKLYEETKDEKYKNLISKYHNFQWAKKIQLNSAYGAVANEWFLFYNADNAEAVTTTGQVIIQWAEREINAYLNQRFGTGDYDYVVASDTDSLYLRLNKVVESSGLTDKDAIIDMLDKFGEEKITPEFERIFDQLSEAFNCRKQALFMKRENISEAAIWRAKKNYAAYVWDSEGLRYKDPEMKIMGMESVRSTTPEICRGKIKEAIKVMFTEGEQALHKYIEDFRVQYMDLPLDEIGRPTAVKDFTKYKGSGKDLYISGAPMHVKAAIQYNRMIKNLGLEDFYQPINDGDKIKFLNLVKFNPVGDAVIGAPDGNFPKEFNIEEYVDRNAMFNQSFVEPVKSLLEAAGWQTEKRDTLEEFFG